MVVSVVSVPAVLLASSSVSSLSVPDELLLLSGGGIMTGGVGFTVCDGWKQSRNAEQQSYKKELTFFMGSSLGLTFNTTVTSGSSFFSLTGGLLTFCVTVGNNFLLSGFLTKCSVVFVLLDTFNLATTLGGDSSLLKKVFVKNGFKKNYELFTLFEKV